MDLLLLRFWFGMMQTPVENGVRLGRRGIALLLLANLLAIQTILGYRVPMKRELVAEILKSSSIRISSTNGDTIISGFDSVSFLICQVGFCPMDEILNSRIEITRSRSIKS